MPDLVGQNITYSDSTSFGMSVPTTFNDVSGNVFNWDKMMYGPELDQQWNYIISDPTTSV